MRKRDLFFMIIFLAINIPFVYGEVIVVFTGYDERVPIFKSLNDEPDGKEFVPDGRIYKYTAGRLMETDMSSSKNSVLLSVKDGVYVFHDTLKNGMVRLQFKLKGKEPVSEVITKLKFYTNAYVAINSEYFYVTTTFSPPRTIICIKYRPPIKIDTLTVKGDVFYATDDYLYYTVLNTEEIEQQGYIYQMNIKDNTSKMILGNTPILKDEVAVVPHLNFVCDQNDDRPIIVDYNKLSYVIASNNTRMGGSGVFYSYEHNAFVFYSYSLDINKWHCLSLNETVKWKPLANPLLGFEIYKDFTGPKVVPFKK